MVEKEKIAPTAQIFLTPNVRKIPVGRYHTLEQIAIKSDGQEEL